MTASSLDKDFKEQPKFESKIAAATFIGKLIAQRAVDKGIQMVGYDRNGLLYHGRGKALSEGARDADELYTDVWASMGQESEAAARREKFKGYQLNEQLRSQSKPDAVILHCLPAHYGEEIDYPTSRLPNSAIFDQAENRMHAQNGLMVLLVGG